VSVSSVGAQGDDPSPIGSISADGRWVAFESTATTLVPGDTNAHSDVFVRDRLTGRTTRVSVAPDGSEAKGGYSGSHAPQISANGRFVAFVSDERNLVKGSAGQHVYVLERESGAIRLMGPGASYASGYFGETEPALSDDGSRVAFKAWDIASLQAEILVADTRTGQVRTMNRLPDGTPGNNNDAMDPAISGDGKWVAFTTASSNLAPPDTNGFRDVIAREVDSGAFIRVSVGAGGAEANLHSSTPALSYDGCEIGFLSSATNLVAGGVAGTKAYIRHRCSGDTELISQSNGGAAGDVNAPLGISSDGCVLTFRGTSFLSPAPAPGLYGAGLRDHCAGATSRQDIATTGEPGNGTINWVDVSATGRYVVFGSAASNLTPGGGDTNRSDDVFVRDRGTNLAPTAALRLANDGARVTADAGASSDVDGPTLDARISFGDGSPEAGGLSATHAYARGGTYTVTVTVTDSDGATASKSSSVTVPDQGSVDPASSSPDKPSRVKPGPRVTASRLVLDQLSLSRSSFAVVPRGGKPDSRRGAKLRLRLSRTATVALRFQRAGQGGRLATIGTLHRRLVAGRRSIQLTGRLGGKALAGGSYRLSVSARTADGRASSVKTLRLTISR
jgi:hypothetical protein